MEMNVNVYREYHDSCSAMTKISVLWHHYCIHVHMYVYVCMYVSKYGAVQAQRRSLAQIILLVIIKIAN